MGSRTPKDDGRAKRTPGARISEPKGDDENQKYIVNIFFLQANSSLDGIPGLSDLPDVGPDEPLPVSALQAARNAVGLSQGGLARALNSTAKTISDTENELTRPHQRTLLKMRAELEQRGARFVRIGEGVGVVTVTERKPRPPAGTDVPPRPRGRRPKPI